ncbi:MAG: hypothetical protein OEV30_03055, partial [Ignavibacteria bacterium]|nr:hypothetical protein [Ignavibacteria bacterium]
MRTLFAIVCATVWMTGSGIGAGLSDIHSPNGVDVWTVGDGGTVYHSLDGGETWVIATLGTADFNGVHSYLNHVWIVGEDGIFYRS